MRKIRAKKSQLDWKFLRCHICVVPHSETSQCRSAARMRSSIAVIVKHGVKKRKTSVIAVHVIPNTVATVSADDPQKTLSGPRWETHQSQRSWLMGCLLSASVENFIYQTLGSDIFHIQFEWRFFERRHRYLDMALLVPSSFDAIVHESNQTGSHDDADSIQ